MSDSLNRLIPLVDATDTATQVVALTLSGLRPVSDENWRS